MLIGADGNCSLSTFADRQVASHWLMWIVAFPSRLVAIQWLILFICPVFHGTVVPPQGGLQEKHCK